VIEKNELNAISLNQKNAFDGQTIAADLKLFCVWQVLPAIPINMPLRI
jgi:hypothetical protein